MSRWSREESLSAVALVLLPAIVVGIAFARVYTVATGVSDTMIYFASARAILNAPDWGARLDAIFRWAPVFPLCVAAIIRWLHAACVYWFNPVVMLACLWAIGAFGWAALHDARAGVLTALCAGWFMLFGGEQYAQFLLYPFREPLSFLFLSLGMLGLMSGARACGRWRYLLLTASGVSYVLSAAVREPAGLALAGALTCLAATPRLTWRAKAGDLLALCVPVMAATLVLILFSFLTGTLASAQFGGWRSMTSGLTRTIWANTFFRYIGLLREMLGAVGLGAVAIGCVVAFRRNRPALLLLLVSALVTLAFYSTFIFHRRYVLSAAVFVAPLAGFGCLGLCELADRCVVWGRPWPGRVACGALAAFVFVSSVIHASRLEPWGRVTMRDLRRFEQTLRAHVAPSDALIADASHRLLGDVLISQLGQPTLCARRPAGDGSPDGCFFLEPIGEGGRTQARVQLPGVSGRAEIEQVADLAAVKDAQGAPVILRLDQGAYTLSRVTPWNSRLVEGDVRPGHVAGGLLWLDLRDSDSNATRRVALRSGSGETLSRWLLPEGNGLLPVFVGDALHVATGLSVVVESDSVLPRSVLVDVRAHDGMGYFAMGEGRRPSAMAWVEPPTMQSGGRWGAAFEAAGAFRMPVPTGLDGQPCRATLVLLPRTQSDQVVEFRYRCDDATLGVFTNRLDASRIRHDLDLPDPAAARVWVIEVEAISPTPLDNQIRVLGIGVNSVER